MSANDELQAHTCEKVTEFYEKPQDYVKKSHNEQTLTKQWKKGELEDGYYYAEDGEEELIIHIQGKNGSVMGDDFDLKATDWIKPIAPVPSFEQWQSLNELLDSMNDTNKALVHRLNICKELLKECREALGFAQGFYGYCKIKNYPCVNTNNFKDDESKIKTCLTKIDEVLK